MVRVGAVALAALLATGAAAAQAPRVPPRVRVEPPACTEGPFDTAAWLGLVRNELETDGVQQVEVAPAPAGAEAALAIIRVEVSPCAADAAEVTVSIDDLVTRKSVRRAVALDDVPPAGRARALALAVAELLRASWAELALPDAPLPEVRVAPAVRRAVLARLRPESPVRPPAPPAVVPPAPRWWAGGTFDARIFPGQSGALLGGRAVVTWDPLPSFPLRLRFDAGGATGTAFARRGDVELRMATAAVGVSLAGGGDRVDVAVGPRIEAGWAWIEGIPASPADIGRTADSAVAFASLTASVRVALTGRLRALVDVSVGQTLSYVTVTADDDRVTGLRGPSLNLGVGVGGAW